MRFPSRAHRPFRSRWSALRGGLVGATTVGVVLGLSLALTTTSTAQTQPLAVAIDPSAVELPMTATEKSVIYQAAEQRRAVQRVAALRAAKARQAQQVRARVVRIARNQIGDRYSAGASGPTSFDCSGLTRYVFKVAAGKDLPHQSRAQYARVKKIAKKDARPGDLVFFFRNGAHHVGVYIGGGRMVDAAGYGKGVRISPISGSWWSRTYSGMGRILPA